MKLSVFTPTHDKKHLPELYNSLRRQAGNVDYEWVLVANGNLWPVDVPDEIREDPHTRLMRAPDDVLGIGALKKFACDRCSGDVFVEVDHDDTLTQDTFLELATAHEKEPKGFYYSDFVNVRANGTCETYGAQYGWVNYPVKIDDKVYVACSAFDANARALSQIYYAPNHIRAWSRDAYLTTGGHDPALKVGDDHDLLCRTYLAGIPFVHIEKALYIYRRWSKQSFMVFNKEIQIQQNKNCNKYLHNLILAECRKDKRVMLNIGRERFCPDGYESLDITTYLTYGKLPDLSWREDSSVGCIRVFDALQLVAQRDIVKLMNEIYRILIPGGWLITSTPSLDDGKGKVGRGAFQDPSHASYWSENNFKYFTEREFAELVPGYEGRFQKMRLWTHYPTDWHEKNFIPYVSGEFCALKGQRQPGEVFI